MKKSMAIFAALAFIAFTAIPPFTYASTTIVVTPTNTQGWSTADTTAGGAVTFVLDANAPAGSGALQLSTDATTAAKAQYLHATNTPLADVTQLSYYTKQVSGPPLFADPSYQLPSLLNGSGVAGFSTLVFEPYLNPGQGPVITNVWQKWDVASGLFYSTRTVTCTATGSTLIGSRGAVLYTLAQIKQMCPAALVFEYGVNIGSNNPAYTVRTDLFNFNGTVYDFEVTNAPANARQCKHGGFVNFTDANGQPFKNQGQCVSFVKKHQDKDHGDEDDQDDDRD